MSEAPPPAASAADARDEDGPPDPVLRLARRVVGTPIARDGAGSVEVGIRLQKAFLSLASIDKGEIRDQARRHSGMALDRAARALTLPEDLARVRRYARMLAPENGSTFMAP